MWSGIPDISSRKTMDTDGGGASKMQRISDKIQVFQEERDS